MSENLLPIFNFSSISTSENKCENAILLAHSLRINGYAVINMDTLSLEEKRIMASWDSMFRSVFNLDENIKNSLPHFGSLKGYTMGYRVEGCREFIETRRCDNSKILPSIPVDGYDAFVLDLMSILDRVGKRVMSCMAQGLGVEDSYILDLCDNMSEIGLNDINTADDCVDISSSLLRICNYPVTHSHEIATSKLSGNVAFGAHTDTSFVTVAPVSRLCGLEMSHLSTGAWISLEQQYQDLCASTETSSQNGVVVFVGDLMQMFSNGYYRSAIHRVISANTERQISLGQVLESRVSCPYIMRGKHTSRVKNAKYYRRYPSLLNATEMQSGVSLLRHPIPDEYSTKDSDREASATDVVDAPSSISPDNIVCKVIVDEAGTVTACDVSQFVSVILPDLEDLNMKLLHRILDMRRQKCMKSHESDAGDWVLCSYERSEGEENLPLSKLQRVDIPQL
jgi:isopenicillin N synthase-like dioxygenase